jgi:symmetrical bis(5'-nucleosyl)-tetraphosphatase
LALYAIGDIQGCDAELGALLKAVDFSADRDRLWFVGDLVNRGPESLLALRRIRALGDAATVTLGNHDLHLLAVALGPARLRSDDTLDEILAAPDRDTLLEWLLNRPLMHEDRALNMCLLHAGLAPQWDIATARACAREFEQALRQNPKRVFEQMYGDEPDKWDNNLAGAERLRFIVNCFTRLRYVAWHCAPRDTLEKCKRSLWCRGSRRPMPAGTGRVWYSATGPHWVFSRIRTWSASIRDASGAAASPHCGSIPRSPNPSTSHAGRSGSLSTLPPPRLFRLR